MGKLSKKSKSFRGKAGGHARAKSVAKRKLSEAEVRVRRAERMLKIEQIRTEHVVRAFQGEIALLKRKLKKISKIARQA